MFSSRIMLEQTCVFITLNVTFVCVCACITLGILHYSSKMSKAMECDVQILNITVMWGLDHVEWFFIKYHYTVIA